MLESYIKVNTSANVAEKASPISSTSINQPDIYQSLIKKATN